MENEHKEQEQQQSKYWDEKEFYKKEVWPKLQKVSALCKQRRIPFMAIAVAAEAEDHTDASILSCIDNRCGEYVTRMAAMAEIFSSPSNPFITAALETLAKLATKD